MAGRYQLRRQRLLSKPELRSLSSGSLGYLPVQEYSQIALRICLVADTKMVGIVNPKAAGLLPREFGSCQQPDDLDPWRSTVIARVTPQGDQEMN